MLIPQLKSYPTGNISKHFTTLKIGDTLDVRGPKGQMKYSPDLSAKIGMIAGGTGITPMLVRVVSTSHYQSPITLDLDLPPSTFHSRPPPSLLSLSLYDPSPQCNTDTPLCYSTANNQSLPQKPTRPHFPLANLRQC